MKTKLCIVFASALAATFAVTSCEHKIVGPEDYSYPRNTDFDVPALTDDNSIRFTYDASDFRVGFVLMGGRIAVDWGDGTPMTKDIHPEQGTGPYEAQIRTAFDHKYAQSGEYTIRIWSEELTSFQLADVAVRVLPMRGTGELHLGDCPMLKTLWLHYLTENRTLDLDGCPLLEELSIQECPRLESISLENCPLYGMLDIKYNPLLTSLDLSGKIGLKSVACWKNGLTELLLPERVEYVNCSDNNISALDLANRRQLTGLYCQNNPGLASLDLAGCNNLADVDFSDTSVEEFDFGAFLQLRSASCADSALTEVDVTGNEHLSYLDCGGLALSSLDISGNPDLAYLDCRDGALSSLDVRGNQALVFLNIANNLLGKEALETVFTALPRDPVYGATRTSIAPPPTHSTILISGNPGAESCNKDIITGKGWEIL